MEYRKLLHRLYRTKMALLATIGISTGTVLLFIAEAGFPTKELGSALFATGVVAIVFEYFNTRDAEERDRQRLREIIQEQAAVIRDSVIDGFAVNHTTLASVASPEKLDHIVENSIAARLRDPELARDVYRDLRDQILQTTERRYDTHVTATLTPWEQGPTSGVGAMFVATIRWDYRATGLTGTHRFASVTNHHEYHQLTRDPSFAKVWFLDPNSGLTTDPAAVFTLLDCHLNGTPQPIHHTQQSGRQTFTVTTDLTPDINSGNYQVSYTYRVLVPKHGHVLFLDINKPSKGLRATFTHHDCGIHYVNPLGFLSSTHNPRMHRSPDTAPTSTTDIGFDGWIFPTDGIAFTWTLDTEFPQNSTTVNR